MNHCHVSALSNWSQRWTHFKWRNCDVGLIEESQRRERSYQLWRGTDFHSTGYWGSCPRLNETLQQTSTSRSQHLPVLSQGQCSSLAFLSWMGVGFRGYHRKLIRLYCNYKLINSENEESFNGKSLPKTTPLPWIFPVYVPSLLSQSQCYIRDTAILRSVFSRSQYF